MDNKEQQGIDKDPIEMEGKIYVKKNRQSPQRRSRSRSKNRPKNGLNKKNLISETSISPDKLLKPQKLQKMIKMEENGNGLHKIMGKRNQEESVEISSDVNESSISKAITSIDPNLDEVPSTGTPSDVQPNTTSVTVTLSSKLE